MIRPNDRLRGIVKMIVLLDYDFAAVDDVQTLLERVETLTGNVEDDCLFCLDVSHNIADAGGVRILNPNHRRLVALTSTIIDALNTYLRPCAAFLYAILEVDAMGTVPCVVVEAIRNFRGVFFDSVVSFSLEGIRRLLTILLYPYGIEQLLGIKYLVITVCSRNPARNTT